MEERRIEKREEVFNKAMLNDDVIGYIRDISLNGMKISIFKQELAKLNGKVKVLILANEVIGSNIDLFGEIRWKKEAGLFNDYGVKFDKFDDTVLKLLDEYTNYVTSIEDNGSGIVIEITETE